MTEPSIAQLRTFVAVARERHFGIAAAVLGVTQPAVSATLRTLENHLGGRLVERNAKGVLLTPLGAALLPRAEQVLVCVDELVSDARRAGRPLCGPLRLGMIPTAAPYLLPVLLGALAAELPELSPEIIEAQTKSLLDALAEGACDLALVALPAGRADLVELPLFFEEFLLLVNAQSDLANRRDLPLSALAELDVLLLEEGHCLRDQAIDVCRQVGASGRTARAGSLTTLAQLVAAGMGTTLLPASAVPVEVRGQLATARFAVSPGPGRRLGLVHRATSTRAEEFATVAAVLRRALRAADLPVEIACLEEDAG